MKKYYSPFSRATQPKRWPHLKISENAKYDACFVSWIKTTKHVFFLSFKCLRDVSFDFNVWKVPQRILLVKGKKKRLGSYVLCKPSTGIAFPAGSKRVITSGRVANKNSGFNSSLSHGVQDTQFLFLTISMHILHTVLYTFPKVLTRRICLTIKRLFSWWSFPLFSWPSCVTQGRYCEEK